MERFWTFYWFQALLRQARKDTVQRYNVKDTEFTFHGDPLASGWLSRTSFTLIFPPSIPSPLPEKSQEGQAAINQKCFRLSLFHSAADAFQCPVLFYLFLCNPPVIIQMPFPNLKFLHKDPCLKLGEHLETTWVGGRCRMKLTSFYSHSAQILEFAQMQTDTVILGKGCGKMI